MSPQAAATINAWPERSPRPKRRHRLEKAKPLPGPVPKVVVLSVMS